VTFGLPLALTSLEAFYLSHEPKTRVATPNYLKDVLHVPTIIKKIGFHRANGGTRFTGNIQPKWMFCERHEELR